MNNKISVQQEEGEDRVASFHFRTMVDRLPQMVWANEDEGRTLFYNQRWAEFTGVDVAEDTHFDRYSLIHPADRPAAAAAWDLAQQTGVYEHEYRLKHHSGEYRWVVSRGAPQRDAEGAITGWYGTTTDFHSRKIALEALQASESLNSSIIGASPDAMLLLDLDAHILFLNEAGRKELQPDHARDIIGKSWFDAFNVDATDARRAFQKALGGAAGKFTINYPTPDGGNKWWEVLVTRVLREDRRPSGVLVVSRDVTEAREGEIRLQESQARLAEAEERYVLAARATSGAVWDWDLTAGSIEWAGAITEALGYAEDAIEPTIDWWKGGIHPDDYDEVSSSLEACIEGRDSHWGHEYRFLCSNGEYAWVYDQGFVVRGSDGEPERMVGAMQNVTERKVAQDAVKRLQADLIQASRLTAMGTVASTLAHELNQPLTAATNWLSGGLKLLNRNPPEFEIAVGAISSAAASISFAGEIIRRVRKTVESGSVTGHPESLKSIIREAVGLLSELVTETKTRCDLKLEAVEVECDRVQIQQVLINLIRNAVEAMRDGPRRHLLIESRQVGVFGEVTVSDSGPGLPPEVREQLFTPFLTTKSTGMGVGLSVCRTIVEAHGGKIWAEERAEGGAAFRFTLPTAASVASKS